MIGERSGLWPFAAFLTAAEIFTAECAAGTTLRPFPTRPGVSVEIHLAKPEKAVVAVLLLEGGPGRLNFSPKGFMSIAHRHFTTNGLAVARFGPPSDQTGFRGGMSPEFRESPAHLADIDVVLTFLKKEFDLPVWLIGISMGSRSAAHYAIQRPGKIDGVVLLSSSTHLRRGRSVLEFGLQRITVPVLAIAHRDDLCRGTPPEGAKMIANASTLSPNATVKFFRGGQNVGPRPCGTSTHHTFYGIEDEVVSAIAAFIGNNSQ